MDKTLRMVLKTFSPWEMFKLRVKRLLGFRQPAISVEKLAKAKKILASHKPRTYLDSD